MVEAINTNDVGTEETHIEQYKVKRLIKKLQEARG